MTTLEEYLIENEKRDKEINKYVWLFFIAFVIFVFGYMAGTHAGYTEALADFNLIKGITIAV